MANWRRFGSRRGSTNPLAAAPLCVDEQYYHQLALPHLRQGGQRRARDLAALVGPPLVAVCVLFVVIALALTTPAHIQRAGLLAPLQARFAGTSPFIAFALVATMPLLVALAMASLWARFDLARERRMRAALDAKLRVARGYRRYLTGLATLTEPMAWAKRAAETTAQAEAPGRAVLVALSVSHDARWDDAPHRLAHASVPGGDAGAERDNGTSRPIMRIGWEASVSAARDALGRTQTVERVTQALAHARSGAIILCGSEGAGKTTLMRYVAHAQALAQMQRTRPGGRIPLYTDLGWLEERRLTQGADMVEEMLAALVERIGVVEAEIAREIASAMLRAPALLLFDELDTLPSERRERVAASLTDALVGRRRLRLAHERPSDDKGNIWNTQVVIGSRSYEAPLGAGPASAQFERWMLEPLAYPLGRLALTRGALAQWRAPTSATASAPDMPDIPAHDAAAEVDDAAMAVLDALATPQTETWLTQPLTLTLAAIAGIGAGDIQSCRSRTDLYAAATSAMLSAHLPDWSADERRALQRVAEQLALWLHMRERRFFRPGSPDVDSGLLRLPDTQVVLARAAETSPSRVIATLSGLCEAGPDGQAGFSLVTLHGFLAGSALARSLTREWPATLTPDAFIPGEMRQRRALALAWTRRATMRWGDALLFMCGALCSPALAVDGESQRSRATRPRVDIAVAWLRALLAQDDILAGPGLLLAATALPELRGDHAGAALADDIARRLHQSLAQHEPGLTRAALTPFQRACVAVMADAVGRRALLDHLCAQLLEEDEQAANQTAQIFGALGQAGVRVAPELIELLGSTIWTPRAAVARALGALGPAYGAEVIPALIDAQGDQTLAVRVAATEALGAMAREPDDTVIQALLARLSDHETDVRAAAALALGKTGASTELVAESLLQAMSDPEIPVQVAAAEALSALGVGAGQISTLVESLAAVGWSERAAAAITLGSLGPMIGPMAETALPALLELSRTDTVIGRAEAIRALARIGPSSAEVARALIERLSDDTPETRRAAAEALGQMDIMPPEPRTEACAALLAALRDPRGSVRLAAAQALVALDAPCDPHIASALFALLDDSRGYVRSTAALALGALGGAAARTLPARIADLAIVRDEAQLVAIDELGMFGPTAKAAASILLHLLADSRAEIRHGALRALKRIISHRAAAALSAKHMNDLDARVRLEAITTLDKRDHGDDRLIVEALQRRLLTDSDGAVRAEAARALGRIGPRAAKALPTLLRALSDSDGETQRAAALAIGALQPALPNITPQLIGQLSDPGPGVRGAVALAFGALGPRAAPTITSELLTLLRDVVAITRASAAEALGLLGPQVSAAARLALLHRLTDTDGETRAAVALALGRIGAGEGPDRVNDLEGALLARTYDQRYIVRRAAIEALAALGPAAIHTALPRLLEMLLDAHMSTRQAAMAALATMDATGQAEALPALRLSLGAAADQRATAALTLAAMRLTLEASDRNTLTRLLGDPDDTVRAAAAQAVGALSATAYRDGPPKALGALLGDPQWRPRAAAAEALGQFGALVSAVDRAALRATLADPDETTRQAAALALARIDKHGANALVGELLAVVKARRATGVLTPLAQRRELEVYAAMERPTWTIVARVASQLDSATEWTVLLDCCALIARWRFALEAARRWLLEQSAQAANHDIRAAARLALRLALADSPDLELATDAGNFAHLDDVDDFQAPSASGDSTRQHGELVADLPTLASVPHTSTPEGREATSNPPGIQSARTTRDLVLHQGGDEDKSA